MSLFNDTQREFARNVSQLALSNPFLPERVELERTVLAKDFVPTTPVWSVPMTREVELAGLANVARLARRLETFVEATRVRLLDGAQPTAADLLLYEDVVNYLLYIRYEGDLFAAIEQARDASQPKAVRRYANFERDARHLLDLEGLVDFRTYEPEQLFAYFFQVRRAFHLIFRFIVGASMPAARLRAAVWQSIFTHDMRRYSHTLYDRMADMPTLITGPSGTGKELVAQAIGWSRYVPFDPKKETFTANFSSSFFPLNLSALSPTLVESELFGHRRGAFTGALQDRAGWLEVCPRVGTVFLDEIGEVEPALQVKLLRVLQTREFQRIGDTTSMPFHGKVITATNRDLAAEMAAGHFREDFYYRLCSDQIVTPSLANQLRDDPSDLANIVQFIAARIVGDTEAPILAAEVVEWIESSMGPEYAWPGNVRELEQCVRNILIRKEYRPAGRGAEAPREAIARAMLAGTLSVDELTTRYTTLVYASTGSYLETARRIGIDRRTVKSRIDHELLKSLRGEVEAP